MAYQLLDVREEEELYKTRLLNVEEKPFKRITKRLVTLRDVLAMSVQQEQTPPPEQEGESGASDEKEGLKDQKDQTNTKDIRGTTGRAARADTIEQLREDVTFDFAAFDSSVARLQFLHTANARERQRYETDRGGILETCQSVRENMVALRAQLEQARATLAQRKVFDDMADRITSSRTLRPRPDQQASIAKLKDECRQLEQDGEAYMATWRERRDQFARIMDESMRLRRLIRDEKEEVERREGMDEEGGGGGSGGGGGDKERSGGTATAAASAAGSRHAHSAGSRTPLHGTGGATSTPKIVGGTSTSTPGTPARDSPAPADYDGNSLRPEAAAVAATSSFSRAGSHTGSRVTSRETTPNLSGMAADTAAVDDDVEGEDDVGTQEPVNDDVDMEEVDGSNIADTQETVEAPTATETATPAAEGGDDKMDTT